MTGAQMQKPAVVFLSLGSVVLWERAVEISPTLPTEGIPQGLSVVDIIRPLSNETNLLGVGAEKIL